MATSTTESTLRATVSVLMHACGERQQDLAQGLRLTQGQVSRKQSGRALWSLSDIDRLAAHYGIAVPDLMAGPSHALSRLPERRRAALLSGTQTAMATG